MKINHMLFSRVAVAITAAFLLVLVSCSGDSDTEPDTANLPQVNSLSPNSGVATATVTITGSNFSVVLAENKITFNGIDAVVTTASSTTLTTTVPVGADTGPVVVKVNNKTAATQPVFTVDSPTPEVSKIAPAFGLPGTAVVITGLNFSTTPTENKVTFNGKDAVVSLSTAIELTATVPAGAATGPIVVTVKGKAAVTQPVFTVLAIPVLTTATVIDIIQTKATGGGTITSEGGSSVTARGICWGTTTAPTTANSKTTNGTGAGVFTSSMTGLTLGITYFVRAYATNSFGTAYGNEVTFKSLPIIGQLYQGGILAYVFQPGDAGYVEGESHGLISTDSDLQVNVKWMGSAIYTATGATGTAIGTGKPNTIAIIGSADGPYPAAELCFNYTTGIYDDWYLASKDELNKLYVAQDAIGGFSSGYYWSSSETGTTAWIQNFSNGIQSTYDKKGQFYVRAVRAF
jgi:hypothetical protein